MWRIKQQERTNDCVREIKTILVDCSQEELNNKIIPLLSKTIKVKNKLGTLYDSSTKTQFTIEPIYWENTESICDKLTKDIEILVHKYNKNVITKNKIIKLSNRRSNRPIDEGLLNVINISQYINPFNDKVNIEVVDNAIIVK